MPVASKVQFKTVVQQPAGPADKAPAAFLVLPKEVSDLLPRRGRTTVAGSLNDHCFQITAEPDGRLSHWLPLSQSLLDDAGLEIGGTAIVTIEPIDQEPEPAVPTDFEAALEANPQARATWKKTTTIARVDWIHWIVTAKKLPTRQKRIRDACDKLASGEKRVCCFDTSGFYSKALSTP